MVNLSDDELTRRVSSLLREQSTMTLATADGSMAWAAPVYFVNIGYDFYFFSEPASRHIRESAASRQAAAAIFAEDSGWRGIRGVQMSGMVRAVRSGIKATRMITAYLKKFSFVRDFFQPRQRVTLEAFSNRFKSRFYCFSAHRIVYLDNQLAFGFRQEISVSDGEGVGRYQ